jgi:serine/threonine protein kinase/WD40 repeat protein
MTSPNSGEWNRVEEIVDALEGLPREAVLRRLDELRAGGEPATILSLVGSWLEMPPLPAPLGAGDVIAGRYQLRAMIGEGGMGSVWRATQSMIGRDVAVKIIHPALVAPALRGRFGHEMEILGQLQHPGIVRIFDAGLHQHHGTDIPFFAMELVEGDSLAGWAVAHREDHGALLRTMSEVCAAVQHAHDRKIVHRDLKPSNIMVRPNGQPVVLDFGVARLAGGGPDEAGDFSGTPQYAAPEQHLGRDRDFRSGESVDVYAMGAILFEVLAGRRLFSFPRGTPMAEIRRAIVEGAAPRLQDTLPGCPAVLDELVARAVRRDPADRYYSIAAMSRALERVASTLATPPEPPPPPWAPAPGAVIPGTDWKLAGKIGEGGAGQVWVGVHAQLEQKRVFKFCDNEEKTRTLKRELTLFRLLKERVGQNPHFIRIHEVSLEEPPWYLMMDHVEAEDLDAWCRLQPQGLAGLSVEQRVGIVAQVAEALQVAHEAGILHRDIKPGNILVGADRARASEGAASPGEPHVFVADFGIGQIIADELLRGGTRLGFTRTLLDVRASSISGTLLYMAPEVMEGGAATARSDLYSLGVVFWQLLIGNFGTALDPTGWSARISDPLLRQDLERCLAGSPEQRWPSAGALATSLRALSERRSAEKKRQEELARRAREAYRRGVMRTALVAAAVIVALSGLTWYAWRKSLEAETQRKGAAAGRARATLGELQGLSALRAAEARSRLEKEMPSVEIADPALKREFRTAAISILAQNPFLPIVPSPVSLKDGDWVAERGERMIGESRSNGLPELVDLAANPPRHQILSQGMKGMTRLRVNVRGIAAGGVSPDGNLHVWQSFDFLDGQPAKHRVISGPIHEGCFALSPTVFSSSKGVGVAVARPNGEVDVLLTGHVETEAIRLERKSSAEEDAFPESVPVTMLEFCHEPEGVLAMAGDDSNLLRFWRISDAGGKLDGHFTGCAWHRDRIRCLKWSPLGREIATGAEDGFLRIWRYTASGKTPQVDPVRQVDLSEPIRDLAWTADGELLAILLQSGNIRVVRAQAVDQRVIANLHQPLVKKIAFLGTKLLVGWGEGQTWAWGESAVAFTQRVVSNREVAVDFHQRGSLTVFTPDNINFLVPDTLAWTGGTRTESALPASWLGNNLFYYERPQWKHAVAMNAPGPERLIFSHKRDLSGPRNYVASPEGRRLAYWLNGDLRSVRELEQEEGTVAKPVGEPVMLVTSDAEPVTAWIDPEGLKIHHHVTGEERKYPAAGILGLRFHPQGRLLACRTTSGVRFIHPETNRTVICPLPSPGPGPTPLAFSADGRWLALCGPHHEIVIGAMPPPSSWWDHQGACLVNLFADPVILQAPSPKRITSLDWNPSGTRLACGTADGFAQSWNLSLLRRNLRLWNLDWSDEVILGEPGFVPMTLK